MARRKQAVQHENHERWLISYADFITLLFAVFVVMFASSQADRARAQQVSASVKAAFEKGGVSNAMHDMMGGKGDGKSKANAISRATASRAPANEKAAVAELIPSLQHLNKVLENDIQSGKVRVHLEARGLVISLEQATFFPSGEDSLDPNTFPTLEKIATTVGSLANTVRLEGHTDSVPIHTVRFHSNWELSAARAIAMLEVFTGRYRITRERFAIAGYAETVPVESNSTAEGRARNRRVDIVILNQQAILNEPSKYAGNGPEPQ